MFYFYSSDGIFAVLCMSVLYACAKATGRIAILSKVSFSISSKI